MKNTPRTMTWLLNCLGLTTGNATRHHGILILTAILFLTMVLTPSKTSAASVKNVTFRWSSAYSGSIIVDYCADGRYTWLTSEELSPNSHTLGSWMKPSGCGSYYIATGVQTGDDLEIGVGTSDSAPGKDLFNTVGTSFYNVWHGHGSYITQGFNRRITPENAWCNKGNCRSANPNGTPCASTQDPPRSKNILDDHNRQIAVVFLKHSPSCGTKWVTVSSSIGALPSLEASIQTLAPEGPTTSSNDYNHPTTDVWTTMRLETEGPAHACGTVQLSLRGTRFTTCFDE